MLDVAREIVSQLQLQDISQKVKPSRLQRVMDKGAVKPTAKGLIDF